jgi:hypothetical protein
MMKRYLFIVALCIAGLAHAQDSYFYFNWDVNVPLANKTWISSTSTRGAKLGFRKFIGPENRFSAGLDVNWAYYQDYKPTETFQQPGGAITTDYFNDIFQMGIAANGQYYFPVGNREHFFPYAGIGLGAGMNSYTVSYNIYTEEENSWGFLARPEAGILVRIGSRRKLGLMAAAHYDFSTSKSVNYGYDNFMNAGFQVGIMLMQW